MENTASKVPFFTSCRLTVSLVGFFGGIVLLMIRSSFSVAVVCMTTPETIVITAGERISGRFNHSESHVCENEPREMELWDTGVYSTFRKKRCAILNLPQQVVIGEPAFDWSRETRSLLLSAFIYGYIATIFFWGILCKRFGPKRILMCATCVVATGTMLHPSAARLSPYALTVILIVEGMCAGSYFPCFMTLWSRWAPPLERTTLIGLAMCGNSVGNILAFLLSGYLCDFVGWEALFYVPASMGLLWVFAFGILVYDTPEAHPRISERELLYLQKNIVKVDVKISLKDVPWKSILTSPPVWAIAFSEFGFNFVNFMMLTELPQYLVDVMETNISEDGLYASLPHMTNLVVAFCTPLFADWMLRRGAKKIYVRKTMQSLALFPIGGIMVALGYLTSDQLSTVLLCLGLYGVASTYRSGSIPNQIEIAPKYAGIVSGIANTVASIPGAAAPFVTTAFVKTGSREEWQQAFLVAGVLSFSGGLVYLLFARTDVQPWGLEPLPADKGGLDSEKKPLLNDLEKNNNNNSLVKETKYGAA